MAVVYGVKETSRRNVDVEMKKWPEGEGARAQKLKYVESLVNIYIRATYLLTFIHILSIASFVPPY